jgi:molecular chaperone GrpE
MIGKKKNKTENEPTPENTDNVQKTQETAEKHNDGETMEECNADQLQLQLDELNDKYLRLYSEFDNYRKRTLKERIEMSKNASEEIIVTLLPVIDDMERAIKSYGDSEELKPMKEGNVLIYNKLLNILQQKGLEVMQTVGNDFDTDFHEAVTHIQAPDDSLKDKIVDEIQKGYLLNGKVIRFAKVIIGN